MTRIVLRRGGQAVVRASLLAMTRFGLASIINDHSSFIGAGW
ncbi:hypothetical protein [Kaistella antarctica]|nr:hypothetical protein [Kaistella antarctica]